MQTPRPPRKKPTAAKTSAGRAATSRQGTKPAASSGAARPARPVAGKPSPAKPAPAKPVSVKPSPAKASAARPVSAKPSPARRTAKPGVVRVKLKESLAFDAAHGEGKRFYQLETLANAIEGGINRGDSWLAAVFRESLMGSRPDSMNLELQWENTYALAFRIGATTTRGQSANLLLVCAKNHQEHNERLRGEITVLNQLAPRCPAGVLPIRAEGTFYLPQKHGGKGRQVLACVRAWPGKCLPAECTPKGQYVLVGPERKLLSRAESEDYGFALALLLLQAFDALTRTGPSLNSLHEGDILCRQFRTSLAPSLMHCPRLTRYRSIQAYVKGLLLWEPRPGSGVYPMQLISAHSFVRALRQGLGDDLAPEAIRRLSAAGGEVSLPESTVAALREAMEQPEPQEPGPAPRRRRGGAA